MTNFIRQHPVASFFLLAITISWIGILVVATPSALPATAAEAERLFVPVYLAMLLGPSAAGLLVTAVAGGHSALREYRQRLTAWRVGARWYAVALLAAPLAVLISAFGLALISNNYLPAYLAGNTDTAGLVHAGSAMSFVLMGIAVGVGAGFFEELGWTGVAVPRLLERYSMAATGILVGLVWGGWHYLAIHWGSVNAMGDVHPAVYLAVALFSFLPPYRVLMVWVYRHTRSLLVGIIMHMALTSSMLLFGPAVSGNSLLVFDLTLGATLWAAALVVLAYERRARVAEVRVEVRWRTA